MDGDGCPALFDDSELKRVLKPSLFELYEKLRSEKAIEAAELEGLETCPFCPYALVIENEHERLFRCGNEECMKVSCRQCKKPDHLPRTVNSLCILDLVWR